MGPYSRGTSHTTGVFFETLYEQPLLIVVFVVAALAVGYWFYRKNNVSKHD
ncbi:hypothetical protein [Methylocucumis oryzae]|uniref:hypothetical protein n=1 Tax=Methylocucumis oryzae TaxID=1632867 RepID=UPI00178CE284|nr:hypothetical protein [Methylocucumis oryzae]